MTNNINDLRKLRIENGITQSLLAEVCGLHVSTINKIESEKIDCEIATLQLLEEGIEIIKNNILYSIHGAIILDKTTFENTLYRILLEKFELLEFQEKYQGNGHHLTQNVIELILKGFLDNK